jgi:anti-anti-sigma factor
MRPTIEDTAEELIGLFVTEENTFQYRLYALTGDLDVATVPEARRVLTAAHANDDSRAIIIDLRDLDYVDTSGLAFLLTVLRDARSTLPQYSLTASTAPAKAAILFICRPGSQPFRMLDMIEIRRFTRVIETLEEAVAQLAPVKLTQPKQPAE